jgi:hypothetical protein
MATDPRNAVQVPTFGMPVTCPAGCGCNGGGGCGCGCGGNGGCGCGCSCCGDACGNQACGGCGGGSGCGGDGSVTGVPTPQPTCADSPWTSCPGGTPDYALSGGDALDHASALVLRVAAKAAQGARAVENLPAVGSCCRVDGGALVVQLCPPAAGPLDAQNLLCYRSTIRLPAEAGWSWTHAYKRSVTTVSGSAANLNTGTWHVLAYTNLNSTTKYYTPPAGAVSALKQETSGWTETQADGTAFRYNSGGTLVYVKNPAGGRWTLMAGTNTHFPSAPAAVVSPSGSRARATCSASRTRGAASPP